MAKGEWEKLSSAVGKAARHTPPHVLVDYELPCFQLQLLDIFVYLAPGMGLGALAMQGSPHLPEDYSPAPSHSIQPRLDPFSGKALEGSIVVFNKEAHVVSRTVFVVFVTVLYLFRFFCVKALHTLTPSHRSDSRTLIQAFITLSF